MQFEPVVGTDNCKIVPYFAGNDNEQVLDVINGKIETYHDDGTDRQQWRLHAAYTA